MGCLISKPACLNRKKICTVIIIFRKWERGMCVIMIVCKRNKKVVSEKVKYVIEKYVFNNTRLAMLHVPCLLNQSEV